MKSALILAGALSVGAAAEDGKLPVQPAPGQVQNRDLPAAPPAAQADVASRVRRIVAEQLGVEIGRLSDETRFIDDLRADSLDFVEMLMAAEEEFNITISDDAAERLVTVGDAIRFVERAPRNEPNA